MRPEMIRNIKVAPVVILVRFPLMLLSWSLMKIGEKAEIVWYWLDEKLPGFE